MISMSIKSCIKGYHFFRVKPHQQVRMTVMKEDNNPYDVFAMVVKIPNLSEYLLSYIMM